MLKRFIQFVIAPQTSLFWIGLMFFLPFTVAYHHLPIASFYPEWFSAVFGVLAMPVLFNKDFYQAQKIPRISLVFVGLAAIVCMQAILRLPQSTSFALLVLSYILFAFVLTLIGSYLRHAMGWEKVSITLAWFVVLGGVCNIIFVGLQVMMKSGVVMTWFPNLPSYGALSQPNNFADYIGLAIASLMYLYAKKQLQARYFWVGLVLFITLLAFSGSRSGWLYLIALTSFSAIFKLNSKKLTLEQQESVNLLLRAGIMLLPLFAVVQFILYKAVPHGLIELPTEQVLASLHDKTSSLRWQFWQTSWAMFTQHPWLGIGVGQMRWQSFLLLDDPAINTSKLIFEHSHNLFVHLLAEMGVAALLLVILAIGAWLRGFKTQALNLESWWVIALLSIISIHTMLEYPLWYAFFLGVFAFLIGMGDTQFTQFNLNDTGKGASKIIMACLFVVAGWNVFSMGIAYAKLEKWMLKETGLNVSLQKDAFFDDAIWVSENSVLAPYGEMMFYNAITPNKENIDDLLALSESCVRLMPSMKFTYQHALLLQLKGDKIAAAKQLRRAMIAYPNAIKNAIGNIPTKFRSDYLDIQILARSLGTKMDSELQSNPHKINQQNSNVTK